MPYDAEISRGNPSCFLFLIDQSGSMEDRVPGSTTGTTKADAVADIINHLLQEITIKCAKENEVRDYFHIGIIGYGATVGSALDSSFGRRDMVPLSELAVRPKRVEERQRKEDNGAGGIVEVPVKFPIWMDSVASGGTPMCQALMNANEIVANWLENHPDCYPPIVFNLTDGEATDADPRVPAQELKNLASSNGNVLLFNIHVSSTQALPIFCPGSEAILPDSYAQALFDMSSIMPDSMQKIANSEGFNLSSSARGFVFNAKPLDIITFVNIGTRQDPNLR